ncbi:YtxH domain-containing protein [Cytobacillus sp. NCCP-133]|uniref:YtxH domain-containing protein n=1 Tax=Cytobacillus sp. NCCP-133 TaxID=766848 RepID=UPI002232AFEF|nr:YtxH domain-containing protein [Cytobacillus sp. NCCP-133]GLB59917.1 hypothetical protein NCCP133_20490 [Cytobacillus sp. NCCP-133]
MEQNTAYNTANTTNAMGSNYEQDMNAMDTGNGQNSKLMKGIVLGGIIGGALAMLDTQTRTKVKTKAMDLKDTSANLISEVKENPGDVKENVINQFKNASNTLKDAIKDAQNLYQRVNEDVFGNMDMVKEVSNEAMSTAKEAKSELAEIGSKVKEAGSELMDNPVENSGTSPNSGSNSGFSSGQTTGSMNSTDSAFPVERDESAVIYSPETQKNSHNL